MAQILAGVSVSSGASLSGRGGALVKVGLAEPGGIARTVLRALRALRGSGFSGSPGKDMGEETMKKQTTRMALSKETLRSLEASESTAVQGGRTAVVACLPSWLPVCLTHTKDC